MHYDMGGNLTHESISLQYIENFTKIFIANIANKYAIEFSQIYLQFQYAINSILLHCNLFAISL